MKMDCVGAAEAPFFVFNNDISCSPLPTVRVNKRVLCLLSLGRRVHLRPGRNKRINMHMHPRPGPIFAYHQTQRACLYVLPVVVACPVAMYDCNLLSKVLESAVFVTPIDEVVSTGPRAQGSGRHSNKSVWHPLLHVHEQIQSER
jgi:hypothetical protein